MAEKTGDQGRVSADEGAVIDRQANTNNFFQVELTGFLSDMLVLFSDFDESGQTEQGFDTMNAQLLEPDQVNDDAKRDDYLQRYQGIIFSTENLCVRTSLEVDRGEETSFAAHKSYFKNKFLRLSALNSSNLFRSVMERME